MIEWVRTHESARRLATASDLAALSSEVAAEIVAGTIVEKATPSFEHGDAQAGIAQWARNGFRGRGDDGRPGGWWIATEVEIDPDSESLTVHRWQADGYLVVLTATRDDVVRAEPFDAIELHVDTLFGADVTR